MEENVQIVSVLEKGASISKNGIVLDHDFIVKGQICARVLCSAKVEIQTGARLIGEVVADEMVVNGTIEGTLYVRGTVRLCGNSKVKGKIYYGDIIIERGALICGESEKVTPNMAAKFFKDIAKPSAAEASAK